MDFRKIYIVLFLFCSLCFAVSKQKHGGDVELTADGAKLIFNNNSQILSFSASPSMSESVHYILFTKDGRSGQVIITNGAGVLSFVDVNGIAGTHQVLSLTHQDTAAGGNATAGDLIIANVSNRWDDLPIGAAFEVLTSNGSFPIWGFIDISNSTNLSATSPVTLTGDDIGFDFSTNNTWTGTLTHQNASDSTSAFRIFDANGGNPVFDVDTTNEKVAIGQPASSIGIAHFQVYNTNGEDNRVEFRNVDDSSTAQKCALVHASPTPADNDKIGRWICLGYDDTVSEANIFHYSNILTSSADVTDGTEDGRIQIQVGVDGNENVTQIQIDSIIKCFTDLRIRTIAQQLELEYDASNQLDITVDSSGDTIMDSSGDDFSHADDNITTTGTGTFDRIALLGDTPSAATVINISPGVGTPFLSGGNSFTGIDLQPFVTNDANVAGLSGLNLAVVAYNHGNDITNATGIGGGLATAAYTGTIANGRGLNMVLTHLAGTITDYRHVNLNNPIGSATIGTLYGQYITNMTKGGTNWQVYSEGGVSYFGGTDGIYFGQTDGDEKVSSDADGTLDLYAGASIDFHNSNANTDLVVNFIGTDNSGVYSWLEDEDHFKYDDDIRMGSAEKVFFRNSNIGIYSQAVTFLDLFAIGSVRIGDSSAGAPTNYANFAPDGELILVGTARVLRSVDFEPDALKKGGVGPADGTEDSFPLHDYDSTNDESVYVHWEIPHDYASAGEIHIHTEWFVDTAPGAAANVTWGVEYKKQSIGDNFDFGAGTTTVIVNDAITTGTPANDKKIHSSAQIQLTTTGFEPMDVVLIRIFRDADASEGGATDNFGSDVRVFNYHLMYLSDKLGEGT